MEYLEGETLAARLTKGALLLRSGASHGGLVLFRRIVRSTHYGQQSRLLTDFWAQEGHSWDWLNRIVYLPESTWPARFALARRGSRRRDTRLGNDRRKR